MNMRIILYLVSLIGFILLTIQVAMFAATIAAYLAIIVIGLACLILYSVFQAGVLASIFVTETICSIADSTQYSEVVKEQNRLRYLENNPNIINQQNANNYIKIQNAERYIRTLQSIYPLADMNLFQEYMDNAYRKQFDNLDDIELQIKQSHRNNLRR